MIDTHAHLNFEKFEGDVGAVIGRAEAKGVKQFIVPSSNLITSQKAVELARRYPEVFAAVGLHPIHAQEMSIEVLQKFYALLSNPKVVAVGEMGLDYFYLGKTSSYAQYPSKDVQKVVFIQMLKLAKDANLPIILHCREAYKDVLAILLNEGVRGPGVVHCFMGSVSEAKAFLDLDFHISFTGNITYSEELNEVIKSVPLERLLLETDAPYLTPESHRGERNEPAYLAETAYKIAKVKGISLAEVEKQTTENAKKLFKLSLDKKLY